MKDVLCLDLPMLLKTVSTEINIIRNEQGLSALPVDASTKLQDLDFDSLMYTVLVTRLEQRLGAEVLDRAYDAVALPSTVGDLADLFGSAGRR